MSQTELQRFGEKLRALRKRHNMTLRNLAVALDLSTHSHIGEMERGKREPPVRLVLKIARFFNVTTDQLLKDEIDLDV